MFHRILTCNIFQKKCKAAGYARKKKSTPCISFWQFTEFSAANNNQDKACLAPAKMTGKNHVATQTLWGKGHFVRPLSISDPSHHMLAHKALWKPSSSLSIRDAKALILLQYPKKFNRKHTPCTVPEQRDSTHRTYWGCECRSNHAIKHATNATRSLQAQNLDEW